MGKMRDAGGATQNNTIYTKKVISGNMNNLIIAKVRPVFEDCSVTQSAISVTGIFVA